MLNFDADIKKRPRVNVKTAFVTPAFFANVFVHICINGRGVNFPWFQWDTQDVQPNLRAETKPAMGGGGGGAACPSYALSLGHYCN